MFEHAGQKIRFSAAKIIIKFICEVFGLILFDLLAPGILVCFQNFFFLHRFEDLLLVEHLRQIFKLYALENLFLALAL